MKIIIFVLLIIILLMICASYKLYDLALNAKSSKEILFGSGDNQTPRKEDRWIYEYDKKKTPVPATTGSGAFLLLSCNAPDSKNSNVPGLKHCYLFCLLIFYFIF